MWNLSKVNNKTAEPLHKKWSFPLKTSLVNVTKSAGNCGKFFCAENDISDSQRFTNISEFSPNTGKYGPEKIIYSDIFNAVYIVYYIWNETKIYFNVALRYFLIIKFSKWVISVDMMSFMLSPLQFVIFNPRKVPWNWIAFSQNSFFISCLLYHLIRRDTGRLASEAFTLNLIVSTKQ